VADYHPLISRLVANLGVCSQEARRSLYARARAALAIQLNKNEPPLSVADRTRERLALDDAIRRVEADWTVKAITDPPVVEPRFPSHTSHAPYRQDPPATAIPAPNANGKNHVEADGASIVANEGWKDRSKEKPLEDDAKPNSEVDFNGIRADLTQVKKYDEETAASIIHFIKEQDLEIIFLEADFPNKFEFFNVERKGNITELTFNRNHPAFSRIFGTSNMSEEDLSRLTNGNWLERYTEAVNAIKIIFGAWARYEREAGIARLSGLQRVRYEWGQIAAQFMESDAMYPL
jgi:hypothetical protein